VAEREQVAFTDVMATHELMIEVSNPPLAGTGRQAAHWVRSGLVR
jgi:hypothetical protein